ncbi:MAG TPA: DNA repair exonuclease [bacterium]|nr:DNA repair exonuclease [bacterium]
MSVRLLHTSDVHLGATFKVLGDRGGDQRRQLQRTFANVVGLSIQERVDVVLIAGDLFDSVAAARLQAPFATEQLGRLGDAGIPVCAIAGNHDPLGAGSATIWQGLATRCPHLVVFGPAPEARVFPERDLTVIGRSVQDRLSPDSPLAGLSGAGSALAGDAGAPPSPPGRPASRRTRHVVGLFHGSVQRPDFETKFGLITPEEIVGSGVDYLALGDWHSTQNVSTGAVSAWYSGAPEMIGVDETDSGNVCLVTLRGPGQAEVVPRRVGRRRAAAMTVDVATAGGPDAVARMIRERADGDLALVVTLAGFVGLADHVMADRLREDLAPEFFRLEIRDESHLRPEVVDPAQYSANTVLGRFVRQMHDQINGREGEDRAVAEEALAYGVALLEGKTEILG